TQSEYLQLSLKQLYTYLYNELYHNGQAISILNLVVYGFKK
ncbi:unnamed protein product, partial [marine sediment metagenome]